MVFIRSSPYTSFGPVSCSGLWSLYFLRMHALQCLDRILKMDTIESQSKIHQKVLFVHSKIAKTSLS